MSRDLAVLPAADPQVVARSLRAALDGSGPAVLPRSVDDLARVDDAWSAPIPSRVAPDTAVVIETSGSSGRPKRVVLSANALLASAAATEGALGGPGQWLLALPVHYIAGLQVLVRSFAAGTQPIIQPTGHFDPALFVDRAAELEHERRYASLVPAQLLRLIEFAEDNQRARRVLSRFDALLIGGQPLPAAIAERADSLGLSYRRTYGSSETSGGCVYDGVPLNGVRVRENEGEIEIAGPVLASGYLADDELTAERFVERDGERWYRTSDGGTFINGVLRVYGRLDNVIISGGVKISLDRVERIVHTVPGFEDAVVVGAPSQQWGQEPVVVLTWNPGPEQRERLRDAVVSELGRASVPRRLLSLERLPVLSSGKPDRRALTRLLASGQ